MGTRSCLKDHEKDKTMGKDQLSRLSTIVGILFLIAGCASRTVRVSVDSNGVQGNDVGSFASSISEDGRYVAFDSNSTNLVPQDTNGASDIFVRDNKTGHITRVSADSSQQQANGDSYLPFMSADGRFVAFESAATNLVPGGTHLSPNLGKFQTFVHDLNTGLTVLANVSSSGQQGDEGDTGPVRPSLSADGRFVAFTSNATNIVAGNSNGAAQVYVHDFQTGQTSRISVDSGGQPGNTWSDSPSISVDGRYVAFRSGADNLVPNDTNNFCDTNADGVFNDNCPDVFVHDRLTGETTRVSIDSNGVEGNNQSYASSSGMSISGDGRYVAFSSDASNLVPGDTNNLRDVFVHDRVTGVTQRVSVDSNGQQATSASYSGAGVAISASGRFVAFAFDAPLTTHSLNTSTNIYVRDRQKDQTEIASLNGAEQDANKACVDPSISANGRFVTFWSIGDNLVPNDSNKGADVFRRAAHCRAKFKGDCAY